MGQFTDSIQAWLRDAGERALRAAVASFTGLALAGSVFGVDGAVDMDLLHRAGVAAASSAVSVVLSLAAKWAGDPTTASFQH